MNQAEQKKHISPVDRTIASKEKLIKRLKSEIARKRAECDDEISNIQFRIQMAQTLLDALRKGRA